MDTQIIWASTFSSFSNIFVLKSISPCPMYEKPSCLFPIWTSAIRTITLSDPNNILCYVSIPCNAASKCQEDLQDFAISCEMCSAKVFQASSFFKTKLS